MGELLQLLRKAREQMSNSQSLQRAPHLIKVNFQIGDLKSVQF
jgi:hypothetical protein